MTYNYKIIARIYGEGSKFTMATFLSLDARSRRGIAKFLQRYAKTGTIGRKQGSGPRPKITEEIRALIEERMRSDDETSAVQLHSMLVARGYELS